MHDLEASISKTELAITKTPVDHADQVASLHHLGVMFAARYKQIGNMDDLDAAISKAEMAVSGTPENHPARATFVNSLGIRLSN